MMCDTATLFVRIHYEGSHSTCVETRRGHSFSLARGLTATGYKQLATNGNVDPIPTEKVGDMWYLGIMLCVEPTLIP